MDTCVGFFDSDGAYPRLNLMPLCPRFTMLEKPEESALSQASHVSSSPVKRACSPCNQKIYNSYRSLMMCTENSYTKIEGHTEVEPCKSTRAAKRPDGWKVLRCQT